MLRRRTVLACALAMAFGSEAIAAPGAWPARVERALALAGDNRPQLERVLDHYQGLEDPLKLEAALFLIGNMEGHGFIEHTYRNAEGVEVPFDALQYPNYAKAREAFEALEKEHGALDYGQKRFVPDLEVITAQYLIDTIDRAFEAWRGRPWAADIPFDVFCEYILPYRGSNEPLDSWRGPCMERLAGIADGMENPLDLREAGRRVRKKANGWCRFDEIYYLHPTDQGFQEMLASGRGRCEDGTNMLGYAFRACAVLSVSDYTPWWAHRDNNHAWEVLLDKDGRGKARLPAVPAKVYRKMFSRQSSALGMVKEKDEQVPRWLSGKTYRDVTDQYMTASDVTLELAAGGPSGQRFAYICVFNGGEWRAIHWGAVEAGRVTFSKMGPGIAYLPAWYVDARLVPAGPPFVLEKDGAVRRLEGTGSRSPLQVAASKAEPGDPPTVKGEPGRVYELLVWEAGDWTSLGRVTCGEAPLVLDVPAGRLYWLVAEGGDRLERIFTIDDGAVVRW